MKDEINTKTPWQDLTLGGNIYEAGNAREFKTGDWRSVKPIYIPEKCKRLFSLFAVAWPAGTCILRTDIV